MLSKDEVKHIATLARIGLSEEDALRYRTALSSVLDWVKELQAVDTETVAPIGHITGMENQADADCIGSGSAPERLVIIANFPETKDGYNKVRAVF